MSKVRIDEEKLGPSKLLKVGTCSDCGKDILMTENEKAFYNNLVRTKPGFIFPKRCKPCISAKKKRQVADLSVKVREMAERAINNEFDGHGDSLAQDLTDLAEKLERQFPPTEEVTRGTNQGDLGKPS